MKPIKLFCAFLLLSVNVLFAQRTVNPQLAALRDEKDSVALEQKLNLLKGSSNENDLRLLMQYYNMSNQSGKAEDIFKLAQQRFPKGESAYIAAGNALITENDPQAKEKLYKKLVKDFPGKNYTMQQYSIADAYAQVNNKKKVLEYAGKFTDTNLRDQLYNILGEQMLKNNDLVTSEYLVRQALDSAKQKMLRFDSTRLPPGTNSQRLAANLKGAYYSFLATYARILFRQGKVSEAYSDIKEAYEHSNKENVELNVFYMTVLLSMNKMSEAFPLMENAIKQGAASEAIKSKLKDAYVSVYGSENGFTAYREKIDQELYRSLQNLSLMATVLFVSNSQAFIRETMLR